MTQYETTVSDRDGGKVTIRITSVKQPDVQYQAPPVSGVTSVTVKKSDSDTQPTVRVERDNAAFEL